ncbi:MAG: HEAT repeat domain-containing protein [Gemmataceae bacterium]|nr:HEAT repeat domain-containing protein [Gemmata sp.]MDW8196269.1 HEAT repeat domain-containing protein [Gemmataceae bacterium]
MTEARKGATRRADISPELLAQLNAGTVSTATLAESLAIDFATLLAAAVPDIPPEAITLVREMAGAGITRRMETVGELLLRHLTLDRLAEVAEHPADTVRGWACYVVGRAPKLKLPARLHLIRPLADDHHFAVREWAWLALRPHLAANVPYAVKLLTTWTASPSASLRRFAVESLRPRGVWCAHIEALKANPQLALPLLEPLKSDPAPYVQDAVANWLNDAAKSQPHWVRQLCARWQKESPTAATTRICTRALRNLR